MMSGEITWNVHNQQDSSARPNDLMATDTRIPSDQNPQAVYRTEELSTVQKTGPEQTQEYFANIIDFPEMWLDMADAPDSMLDTNWFDGI
jgi:hypothetical protein